jgi:hypothetical protein
VPGEQPSVTTDPMALSPNTYPTIPVVLSVVAALPAAVAVTTGIPAVTIADPMLSPIHTRPTGSVPAATAVAVAADAMLQALGIILLALFTAPTADPITTADADFGSESAVSTGQTLPTPTAVWQSIPIISPSQAPPQSAPTAVWLSMTTIPSSPAPTVVHAMLLPPTPTVVHTIPPPPAPTAMWQPMRTNTNATTAVAVATDAMSASPVTNDCGRIKHQIDDASGLLHSHLIISPHASFPIPDQLVVQANDTAGQSMAPQTDCAGNSQLRHMSAWHGWTPGTVLTGLLSPLTLLKVREQLTRLSRFSALTH